MGSWRVDFYLPGKAEYRDKVREASDEAVWVCTGFQRVVDSWQGFEATLPRTHGLEN